MELLMAALVVLAGLYVTPQVEGLKVDIASHLRHLATHRYPNEAHKETRQRAAEYISGRFEEYGLRVDLQLLHAFATPDHTSAASCPHGEDACLRDVEGVNIIGISGPEREKAGAVVVVGAAYDTDGVGNPLHNNGAGVAVLLETARLYQATAPRPHLATLFVALDLSVESYGTRGGDGGGLPGAWSMVQDYLRSFVAQNTSMVGGAIVLGPLMNVNHEDGSQGFDSRLKEMFPAAHEQIAAWGHRGDFLAMVTRESEEDEAHRTLGWQVAQSYREVGGRLVELSLGNRSHTLLPPALPSRQAAAFWGSTYRGSESSLPAILLTDTETSRKWPQDAAPHTHLTESQQVFLDTTVISLVHFLVRRQAVEDWWEVGLFVALLASGAVNLLLLLRLRRLCTSSPTDKGRPEAHCPSEALALKDTKCSDNGVSSLGSVRPWA